MNSDSHALHVHFQFRVALSSDGYDVIRSIRGNAQVGLVLITYPDKSDADHLVETLKLLEIRRRLRIQSQRRKSQDAQHSR